MSFLKRILRREAASISKFSRFAKMRGHVHCTDTSGPGGHITGLTVIRILRRSTPLILILYVSGAADSHFLTTAD